MKQRRAKRLRPPNLRHGHRGNTSADISPTYEAWRTMIRNCTCKASVRYVDYGALGVTVCDRWLGQQGFTNFLADLGVKPPKRYLSRRDKTRNFTPENTYWATSKEVGRHRRNNTFYTVNGVTKCLVDWAKQYGIPKNTLHYRVVTRGMTMRDALDVGRGCSGRRLD